MRTDQRFRAVRDGAVIRLSGCATHDSSPSEILNDLCDMDCQVYDLSALMPGSWMGMRALREAMVSSSLSVVLRSARRATLLQLQVLDSDAPGMVFETAVLPSAEPPLGHEHEVFLDEVEVDTQGFARWRGVPLLGFGPVLKPNHGNADLDLPAAIQTLLRYCEFAEATVVLACTIVDALEAELGIDIERVAARTIIYDRVLPGLDPDYRAGMPALKRLAVGIRQHLDAPRRRIQTVRRILRNREMRIQQAASEGHFDDAISVFSDVAMLQSALQGLAGVMESSGVRIGEQIGALHLRYAVEAALKRVASVDYSGEALEDLRDDFEVMDIEGEDCWTETHALLMGEYDQYTEVLDELFTTMHGFDRARQILEHRLAELEAVDFSRPTDLATLDRTVELLIDMAREAAVTEQEDLAFIRFFDGCDHATDAPVRAPVADFTLF